MKKITLDLPYPPSVNRIWRISQKKGIYRHPDYVRWLTECGWILKAAKPGTIKGSFAALIILYRPDNRKADQDNRVKAVLDCLQKFGVIKDDCNCDLLILGKSPKVPKSPGVRVILGDLESDRPYYLLYEDAQKLLDLAVLKHGK